MKHTRAAARRATVIFIIIIALFSGNVSAQAGSVKTGGTTSQAAQHPRRTTSKAGNIKGAGKVARQDLQAIRKYTRKEYPGYKVKIAPAEKTPDCVLENRAGKKLVYIDQFKTKSRGRYGVVTTAGPFKGRKIEYKKRHKPGKIIHIYLIYNPYSNYIDDIPASVEAGKIYK